MDILRVFSILLCLLVYCLKTMVTTDVLCYFDICTVGEQFCNNSTRICDRCQHLELYCQEKKNDTSCLMFQCFKKEKEKFTEVIQQKNDQIDDLLYQIETKNGELVRQQNVCVVLGVIIGILVLVLILENLFIIRRHGCLSKETVRPMDNLQETAGSDEICISQDIKEAGQENSALLPEVNGEKNTDLKTTSIEIENDIKLHTNIKTNEESINEQRSKFPPSDIQPTQGNSFENAALLTGN